MIKVISETGNWNIEIDGIIYNFYYSNAKPIEGLILNGCDIQEGKYQIGNYVISGTKEEYICSENGYRYVLTIEIF